MTDNARETTGIDVFDWAIKAADLGAGEILLTSVDKDGTGRGYDLELIKKVTNLVDIPVIISGGAGKMEHVKEAVITGKADAISLASIFHYNFINIMGEIGEYNEEGNIDFLRGRVPLLVEGRKGIEPTAIYELKKFLVNSGINCRLVGEKN